MTGPSPLANDFLAMADGDATSALEMACAALGELQDAFEARARDLSAGFLRLPPAKPPAVAKPAPPPAITLSTGG